MFEGLSRFRDNAHMPRAKRYAYKSDDATLEVYEQVVSVDSSSAAITITMPSVEEAAGMAFDIDAPSGGSNAVTINDAGGTSILDKGSTNTLDADDDYVTLVSTGKKWRHVDYVYD